MRYWLRGTLYRNGGVFKLTIRTRLIYEKRGGACFVPHVALATVFTRAARRAGLELRSTDGFSPHAKMSFGPELPAGVVALWEPVDVWLKEPFADLLAAWNAQMPDGFRIKDCFFPKEDEPALGKVCKVADYHVWPRKEILIEKLLIHLKSHYGADVLEAFIEEAEMEDTRNISHISFVVAAPAQNGIGGWVKSLVAAEILNGWQDLCIVRRSLGDWNEGRVKPLTGEGMGCL